MVLKLTLILLAIGVIGAHSAALDCKSEVQSVDKCLGNAILVGVPQIPMFETIEQLDELYCDTYKANLKCAKKYSKCLKAFPRTIYGVAVNGLKKVSKICSSEEQKQTFLDNFKCFVDRNTTQDVSVIINRVTLAFEHVLTVPQADMIPTLCCAYHTVIKKAGDDLDVKCTRPGTTKYFIDLVHSALADPIDLLCGGSSQDYESCKAKYPEWMETFNNVTADHLAQEFKTTPIIPALQVVAMLDSDF